MQAFVAAEAQSAVYGGKMDILYSFRRCPYAMRARMALLAVGEPIEIREILLRAKPAAMIAVSPKATVPVLVAADGAVIAESLDIMRRALSRRDPEGWLVRDDAGLIAGCDDDFKHHLDRYKYAGRYAGDQCDHRAAAVAYLAMLEDRLGEGQLGGAARGLADIAIFPFVRQFAAVEPEWFAALPMPRVRRWLAGHVTSALFARAMIRLAPWVPGDRPILFGSDSA